MADIKSSSIDGRPSTPLTQARVIPNQFSQHSLAGLFFFGVGSALNGIAYGSPDPMFVSGILFAICICLMHLLSLTGPFERKAFLLSFCVCWFWSGIAAIYAEFFSDPSQNNLDAAYFFEMITKGDAANMGILDLVFMLENGGAMLLWRTIYDLFSILGFEKVRYVGIAANVSMVSLSAVAGVRMVATIFGEDSGRKNRFILFFTTCGLFWMFAAIHLRDSAVLLSVTVLTQYWVRFLATLGGRALVKLIVASIIAFAAFGMLRTEFVFVPVAMLIAGLLSIFMASSNRTERRRILFWTALLGVPLGIYLIIQVQSDLGQALLRGRETYNDLSAAEGAQGSLGNSLIMGQPLPLRLTFGFLFLLIFPIPAWSGLLEKTAYHLFKSFHVLFMYAILPLVFLSVTRVFQNRSAAGAPILFLLFVVCGFALSISYTSLENRHFGAFLISLIVLATYPDLRVQNEYLIYRRLFSWFLLSMVIVHIAWGSLKTFL